MFKVAAVLF